VNTVYTPLEIKDCEVYHIPDVGLLVILLMWIVLNECCMRPCIAVDCGPAVQRPV
jgi:hypothetical protein